MHQPKTISLSERVCLKMAGARLFRELRGVRLSYEKQGLIYFTCMNYRKQSEEVKQKITDLCGEVCRTCGTDAELYYKALFELLTNPYMTAEGVVIKYFVSDKQLYNLRRSFYEKWSGTSITQNPTRL